MESLKEYCETAGCAYLENEPMSAHTTFRIGGKADVFIKPASEEVLKGVLAALKETGVPYYCIGGGSNLLVSDFGIRGAALYTGGFSDMALLDGCVIECGAGVKLSRMCSFALENSLSGCEFAWGIPGTVGGAVYMNAGAYGGEIKDVALEVYAIDENGNEKTFSNSECNFGYRSSVFSSGEYIITGAKFRLRTKDKDEITAQMRDYAERRRDRQPLSFPSAGSTFKRPEGYFAGKLIQDSGLRGFAIGGAAVSEKHCGFVVNTGNATCSDVVNLIDYIKKCVYEKFGVMLHEEVRIIGRK